MAEAQSTNEETLTENLAFAEVLAWSATRPAWQRDALRRLVQSGILGSEEIDCWFPRRTEPVRRIISIEN